MLAFLFSCVEKETPVEKYLSSKYVDYEIVSVFEDSANVVTAKHHLRALIMRTADTNLEIAKALNRFDDAANTAQMKKEVVLMDSLYSDLKNRFVNFESTRFIKPDPCYFVRYRIPSGNDKIEKDEYVYFNPENEDIIARPVKWEDFLLEQEYDKLIKSAVMYSQEIKDLKQVLKM